MFLSHTRIKLLSIFILSTCCFSTIAKGNNSLTDSRDSLVCLLNSAPDNERKLELLTHLSDIGLLQDTYEYTLKLWDLALECNDQEAMSISLRPLALRYLDLCQLDSADIWINKCRKYLKGNQQEKLLQYLCMMRDIRDMTQRKELAQKLVSANLTYNKEEDRYKKMRWLYSMGAVAIMTRSNNEKLKPWDAYIHEGLEIARTIPLEEDFVFRTQFLLALGGTKLEYTKELMEVYKEYRNLPSMKKRIFASHRTEIAAVARMLSSGEEIGRQQMDYYFKEFNRLIKLYPLDVAPPLDFYYYYVASKYYEYIEDYPKTIECCDSVIKNAPKYGMDSSDQYQLRSKCLASMGRWEEAYQAVNEYMVVKDSIDSQDIDSQLTELQTQYDVNKLQLEKATLISRQQKAFLWFAYIILFVLTGGLVYIYRTLIITRHLKKNVEIQSNKALESEKMKVLFMNSMSHEIRTPLNAIQGFSDLLLSENIEEEMKPLMKESLEQGVTQLTDLLNDMLQISQLGCTDELLPLQEVNINMLCKNCVTEEQSKCDKKSVTYTFENRSGIETFNTNQQHLAKILHNLLANASKFTPEGQVTVTCSFDAEKNALLLSVTDTGIGIPIEKQEWVFEAFTKMDDFTPGTGLGLYVCREIIKHLKGSIYIDSSYQSGTRVMIELPQIPT